MPEMFYESKRVGPEIEKTPEQEFREAFFSDNWETFQKIPEIISRIKKSGTREELNGLLQALMQEEKEPGEFVSYTETLEKSLKKPEGLPRGIDVEYTPLGEKGGDDWSVSPPREENGKTIRDISFSDFEEHGEKVANLKALMHRAWEVIKKNVPEEDWYRATDRFLENLKKQATSLESGIAMTMNLVRIEEDASGRRQLKIFGSASESWSFVMLAKNKEAETFRRPFGFETQPFVLLDKKGNEIYLGHDDFQGIIPSNKMKLGLVPGGQDMLPEDFYLCESGDISEKLNLSDWELYGFTDGLESCKLENKMLGEDATLEEKIREIFQSDDPWEKLKELKEQSVQGDDITMIRICS